VSAPDPSNLSDPVTEPRWILKLQREGALVLTLAADSQAERDDWFSTLQVAADNPIKVFLVNNNNNFIELKNNTKF
jgi:hypothetical protein